jgi:hypothetical protein
MHQQNSEQLNMVNFFNNIKISEEKEFQFATSFNVKYREVSINEEKVSLVVAASVGDFAIITPKNFNYSAKSPFLVTIKIPTSGSSPFLDLKKVLEAQLARPVDSSYNDSVYMNVGGKVFNKLKGIVRGGCEGPIDFMVQLNHITFGKGNPRAKFQLMNVEDRSDGNCSEESSAAGSVDVATQTEDVKPKEEETAHKEEPKSQRKRKASVTSRGAAKAKKQQPVAPEDLDAWGFPASLAPLANVEFQAPAAVQSLADLDFLPWRTTPDHQETQEFL